MTQKEIDKKADEFEYTNGIYGFKEGVKFAQNKMYSEEEVLKLLNQMNQELIDPSYNDVCVWFKVFKKK